MATLAEFLAGSGVGLDEGDVVGALRELVGEGLRPAGLAPLPADELAVLRAHGGIPTPRPDAARRGQAATIAAATGLVVGALSTNEVADRLGVDASRVRHRAAEGSLYALRLQRQNRYPRWQFAADGPTLPGLREVLAALPDDLHPLAVEGFMRTPQPEYEVHGRELNAIEWLAAGGDPEAVVALAAALDHAV